MRNKKKKNWAQRMRKWIFSCPLIIIFVLIAYFIGQFDIIGRGLNSANNWYKNKYKWQEIETKKINDLKAGMNIDQIKENFDEPLYVESENGITENIFKGKGYWLQTFSSEKSILFYSVTDCDNQFDPAITINSDSGKDKTLTLGKSTLNNFDNDYSPNIYFPTYILYHPPSGSADSYFYEGIYLANPGDYKTIFFGINNICNNTIADSILMNSKETDNFYFEYYGGSGGKSRNEQQEPKNVLDFIKKEEIVKFRSLVPVNTYGITAPFIDLEDILDKTSFRIGINSMKIN